jgi:predicted  nucleic acid-binding Zn-ribbon protein
LKDKATCLSELSELELKITRVKDELNKMSASDQDFTRREKMTRRFENLEKKKSRLLYHFDLSLRAYIEKLENRYHHTSVVTMNNALCPGCNMKLPTREAVLLRNPNQFVICNFCGRIILSSPVNQESKLATASTTRISG